jgi:hypothetical protein
MPQVTKLKESFGLERVVLVGDRGMISYKAIGELKDIGGMAWITALKSSQIRGLVEAGALQLGLFDERNLFEPLTRSIPMSGSSHAVIRSSRSPERIEVSDPRIPSRRRGSARRHLRYPHRITQETNVGARRRA